MRFLLIDEGAFAEEELKPLWGLVSLLFRLENAGEPEALRRLVEELIAEVRRGEALELERAFTVWLKRVLLPARVPGVEIPEVADLTEVRTMLAERVKQWTLHWKQEGLQQGRRVGLQQGEAKVLERLLGKRFGPLPQWAREKLRTADVERLEQWADRLLEADSLEALLGDE